MKSYKALMNSLSDDPRLRVLSDEEIKKLRKLFIESFVDLRRCCDKYGLTVMLIGGSALGAVRHKGFIPWDDDLDVAMSRDDYQVLKTIFQAELGEKYILAAPNYKGTAKNRFPQILIKNTRLIEAGSNPENELNKIKLDIFLIESIPEKKLDQYIKGMYCSLLMGIASYTDSYQNKNDVIRQYMYKTPEGRRAYWYRMCLGRLFSFRKVSRWYDLLDRVMQYKGDSSLAGIPSGRKHYFGEIRPKETFFPTTKGEFEGLQVDLPGKPDDYLTNLYGKDYMTLPSPEKREKHLVIDISFETNGEDAE